MAITANVDLGNGVTASSCYIIIPVSCVKKFREESYIDEEGNEVVTSAEAFKLVYDIDIYQNKSDSDTSNVSERLNKRISCREVDRGKIDYDPTSGEQNAFKLAYADLKTNSKLSSVADV